MPLLETLQELFDTTDLYAVVGVEKAASQTEIKKGYYKVSLKVHPDRASPSDKASATAKFQALVKVYAILSDKERRAVYDEQGIVEEEGQESFDQAYEHWRKLFRKVTVEDIESFAREYQGSQQEKDDLKEAYLEFDGSMEKILVNVLCCTFEDEDRFRTIIDSWIAEGAVPDFPAYSGETKKAKKKRRRRAEKEADEAEELKAELGIGQQVNAEDGLRALIQKRHASRSEDLFASLEAKYCSGSAKGKRKQKADGPSKAKKQKK